MSHAVTRPLFAMYCKCVKTVAIKKAREVKLNERITKSEESGESS